MAEVTYTNTDDAQRRAVVIDRLASVEAEHWRLSVDEAAGTAIGPGPAGFPPVNGPEDEGRRLRLAALESAHEALTAKLAEIDGTPAQARRKSS